MQDLVENKKLTAKIIVQLKLANGYLNKIYRI